MDRTSFEKEVSVAPWSTARLDMPVAPGAPGLHQCEISITPDDLALDDRYCLTIPVMEKEGILIVSDSTDPEHDAVLFLKTALNPYENFAGSLLPEHVSAAGLNAARLAAVRKVFFTRAGKLDEATCKLLADFVFHGGGITYFLDGENDAANVAALERAAGAGPFPLKLGARRVAKNVGARGRSPRSFEAISSRGTFAALSWGKPAESGVAGVLRYLRCGGDGDRERVADLCG